MAHQLHGSLYSGITNLTNFLRVEFLPSFLMKLFIKLTYKFCVNEVDESIANIALILNKFIVTL